MSIFDSIIKKIKKTVTSIHTPKIKVPDIPDIPIPDPIAPTKHYLEVNITNGTKGSGYVVLYHKNNLGINHSIFEVAPDQTVGSMGVNFDTGILSATAMDYWGVVLCITHGEDKGVYHSGGSFLGSEINSKIGGLIELSTKSIQGGPLSGIFGSDMATSNLELNWKECQLQNKDVGHPPTLNVDTRTFEINLRSGSSSADMKKLDIIDPRVQHIFVLMLENHSFDNVFAMSGIPGIVAANTNFYNSYQGVDFHIQKGAPDTMPTDPGHEFQDVFEQLTTNKYAKEKTTYHNQTINHKGFVESYATSTSEDTGTPSPNQIGDIMKCFDTPNQLPVTYHLATEFAVCDHWFSSLPGPTWPNRFFVHGATSSGLDASPSTSQMAKWESVDGFEYENGSVFDMLGGNVVTGHPNWSIYQDKNGPIFGSVPQVSAIKGVYAEEVKDFSQFKADLSNNYTSKYTFIEPNYGDTAGNTYQGGSSQHPMDGMQRGEELIKNTYEAIRNSPLWESSLLIITYDEHGGFYDSIAPPAVVAPGDSNQYNVNGFDFTQLGVRVPAIIVSPYISKGTVSHTQFEHSSIPATIEKAFGYGPLTKRDAAANDLFSLLTLNEPRTDSDCIRTLPPPITDNTKYSKTEIPDIPLNESGNNIGFLHILLKSELHLVKDEAEKKAIQEQFSQIKSRQDAAKFMRQALHRIEEAKE